MIKVMSLLLPFYCIYSTAQLRVWGKWIQSDTDLDILVKLYGEFVNHRNINAIASVWKVSACLHIIHLH